MRDIIAGPCSAESLQQVLETAGALHGMGIGTFRAGIWKPRTRPGAFEGAGEEGLAWLTEVRSRFGMKVCTEVATAAHVEAALKAGIDILWIGARTTTNPFQVQEVADALRGCPVKVFVKNPVSPDLGLWTGAVERLSAARVGGIGLIHRGFSVTEDSPYRNVPQWGLAVRMRSSFPELEFLCDPSHMAGRRELVGEIAQRAVDLGLDGLMVEVHCCPDRALSDARQQLTPEDFRAMLDKLDYRSDSSQQADFNERLSQLRSRIDVIDGNIIEELARRMELSREIGRCKSGSGVAIIQRARWNEVLERAKDKGRELGLDGTLIEKVFDAIHEASVAEQSITKK